MSASQFQGTIVDDVLDSYRKFNASGEDHTARARRRGVIQFFDYLKDIGKAEGCIGQVVREDIVKFKDELLDRGYAAATVKQRLTTVSGIYKHLRYIAPHLPNPCHGLRRIKLKLIKPTGLPLEDVLKLLAEVGKLPRDMRGLRCKLWFELGLFSGARLNDLRKMTIGGLDLVAGIISDIIRKNSVENDIALTDQAIELFKEYLPYREELLRRAIPNYDSLPERFKKSLPIFPTPYALRRCREKPKQWRLSDKAIYLVIRGLGETCGVAVHPHALRHTFAHEFLRLHPNLRDLANALGHGSIQSSMIYTHEGAEKTRSIVNQGKFYKEAA